MAPVREALPYHAFVGDPSATASAHKRQRVGAGGMLPLSGAGLVVRAVSLHDFGKATVASDATVYTFTLHTVVRRPQLMRTRGCWTFPTHRNANRLTPDGDISSLNFKNPSNAEKKRRSSVILPSFIDIRNENNSTPTSSPATDTPYPRTQVARSCTRQRFTFASNPSSPHARIVPFTPRRLRRRPAGLHCCRPCSAR
jgi:hypothetical protein